MVVCLSWRRGVLLRTGRTLQNQTRLLILHCYQHRIRYPVLEMSNYPQPTIPHSATPSIKIHQVIIYPVIFSLPSCPLIIYHVVKVPFFAPLMHKRHRFIMVSHMPLRCYSHVVGFPSTMLRQKIETMIVVRTVRRVTKLVLECL